VGNSILVEIQTDSGIAEVGEVTGSQNVSTLSDFLVASLPLLPDESSFDVERLLDRCYRHR
jgi:hypothetical protein